MKTFAPKQKATTFSPPAPSRRQSLLSPHQRTLADLAKPLVQPKLLVNQPGNQYEYEADRVAEHVISSNAAGRQTVGSNQGYIFSKTTNGSPTPRWGHDFSKIRVSAAPTQVQTKLTVNEPGDRYEQEADRVAEEVMRTSGLPDGAISAGTPPNVQKKCAACESGGGLCPKCAEEEKTLQRKALSSSITPLVQRQNAGPEEDEETLAEKKGPNGRIGQLTSNFSARINSLLGRGGQPLTESERNFFEPKFGHDFSKVRIYADGESADVAHGLNARAFTIGNSITFGAGQYAPETSEGRRLMAHELVHTIQQTQQGLPSAYNDGHEIGSLGINRGAGGWKGSLSLPQTSLCVQRLGDPSRVPPDMTCPIPPGPAPNVTDHLLFPNAVSSLSPLQVQQIDNFVANWQVSGENASVRIDGFASTPGSDELNWRLSCERAQAVANEMQHPSDGTPGIPATHIEVFAQGETAEFGAAPENRRVNIFIPSAPPPPPPPSGCTTVTAVPGSSTPTLIGSRGGCGSGADFASHDFPTVPLALQLRSLLNQLSLLPDRRLEALMHGELSLLTGSLGTSMATHFDGGSGSTLRHAVGSALSSEVDASPTFAALARATEASIITQISTQVASNCHIDWTTFNVLPSSSALPATNFSLLNGDRLLLQGVLGGTQGLRIFIRDFNLNMATHGFTATLIFEICDDFGVDQTDLDPLNPGHGSPGLVAFWILQHERPPRHVAFINEVVLEKPISGSI